VPVGEKAEIHRVHPAKFRRNGGLIPMKKIILGVSSSVSIYKACEIVRRLQEETCNVQVIMTPNAAKLVSPQLFRALSGREVYVELFEDQATRPIPHIDMAQETELFLVAPATANLLGKFASGVADDFLTTIYLAVTCPVLLAPAMNENMYLHTQTQANIRQLRIAGVEFIEPAQGSLACGVEGWGRLAAPEEIVARALKILSHSESLKGRNILVTAGPTREYLDPVRYLSNRSSGKMGYALAQEAVQRGASVTLVSGPSQLFPPRGVNFKRVESASEMREMVLSSAGEADIVIMAAAVSDYRFANPSTEKLKKHRSSPDMALERTPDILAELGKTRDGTLLVGFAAETENLEDHAREKIQKKNLDLLVANDVSRSDIGFDSDLNQVSLYTGDGLLRQTDILNKREISRIIWDEIEVFVEGSKRKTAN
jgi:phosphopantothenoylcysteine decarboxylase/phosphopantothenate--cysteine ligase